MGKKAGKLLNVAKLSKLKKLPGHGSSILSRIRAGLFELDFYSYTPSLISTEFSTWVSLVTSLTVAACLTFCTAYLLYLWLSTPFGISEGEVEHDASTVLVPFADMARVGQSALVLPSAGVVITLGSGTALVDSSVVQFAWEQVTICSGASRAKLEDPLPSSFCSFYSTEDGHLRTNATNCADWNAARSSLGALGPNRTASNPCGTSTTDVPYVVPRVSGTFYAPEYSYITATISINVSALASASFSKDLFKGSVQLYLQYPYTGTQSLLGGHWPDGQQVVWSRRVNLLPSTTMKWEATLRTRNIQAASFWWDIPQLSQTTLDYKVQYTEVSMATAAASADGWIDVAKVYIKLDDRDMQVQMSPYRSLFSLFSDLGGFLSILMALGLPAMLYNYSVFRNTVESLIHNGDISFDEELRKHRSRAIHTSFAAGKFNGMRRSLAPSDSDMAGLGSMVLRGGSSMTQGQGQHSQHAPPGLQHMMGPHVRGSVVGAAAVGAAMGVNGMAVGTGVGVGAGAAGVSLLREGSVSPVGFHTDSAMRHVAVRDSSGRSSGGNGSSRRGSGGAAAGSSGLPPRPLTSPSTGIASGLHRFGSGRVAPEPPLSVPVAAPAAGSGLNRAWGELGGEGQGTGTGGGVVMVQNGAGTVRGPASVGGSERSDSGGVADGVAALLSAAGGGGAGRKEEHGVVGARDGTQGVDGPAGPVVESAGGSSSGEEVNGPGERRSEGQGMDELPGTLQQQQQQGSVVNSSQTNPQQQQQQAAVAGSQDGAPLRPSPDSGHAGIVRGSRQDAMQAHAHASAQNGGRALARGGSSVSWAVGPETAQPGNGNGTGELRGGGAAAHAVQHSAGSAPASPFASAAAVTSGGGTAHRRGSALYGSMAMHGSMVMPGGNSGNGIGGSAGRRRRSTDMASECGEGDGGMTFMDVNMGMGASILVSYDQDIFQDSDEETNDFDDVVRHCTSECHALYHLRQVVKLVQHQRTFLTCGLEGVRTPRPPGGRQ